MNEIYDRYKTIRDSRNIKDSQVAKETGITKSTFSEWKSGKYTPKQEPKIPQKNIPNSMLVMKGISAAD